MGEVNMSKGMAVRGRGRRRWVREEMVSEVMANGGFVELEETPQASLHWFSGQTYSISLLHLM